MKPSMLASLLLALSVFSASAAQAQRISLRAGQVIDRTAAVSRAVYRIPNSDGSGSAAAITIRGNDLVVDFAGATLEGTPQSAEPDQRAGTGLRVEGSNVTIKNLRVRGYKIGLIAVGSPGLKVLNCDLSYNCKQRLASGLDREDESDWMSYHRNEKDEWLEYGAGIYLRKCDGFLVKGVTVCGGQCGLMLMECNKGLAYNNNFSFLSGIGLGMYQSSDNRILHNRIDWCVRGYSHGVYNRGQDSAGILIYEQSSHNTFAYNSVTHGGDGFFLWAGQTTMDTGDGGCNDNLVYGNDFSHAPTNGIEATFSRNIFANNLVMECWHGVWGGYSYDTKILGNLFAYNAESISIEHGQHIAIRSNLFFREGTAIHVWDTETVDPTWGYGKHRDIASHDYDVSNNFFNQITQREGDAGKENGLVLRLKATSDFGFGENKYGPVGGLYDVRGPLTNFHSLGATASTKTSAERRDGSGKTVQTAETTITVGPADVPQLGSGWDSAHEGSMVSALLWQGLLPPVMHSDGNVILPYPEGVGGYSKRFQTNWDPLKTPSNTPISVGAAHEGDSLMLPQTDAIALAPAPMPDGIDPYLHSPQNGYRGRGYILIDRWGPYDFQSPMLWPRKRMSTPGTLRKGDAEKDRSPKEVKSELFEILGPRGRWTASKVEGGALSSNSGSVPGYVEFTRSNTGNGQVKIELVYTGAKTVDYRGIPTGAGSPVPFRYSEFSLPIQWHVNFFKYDKATQEPRTQSAAFRALITGKPVAELQTSSLDLAPGRIPGEVGNDYFATIADGEFEIEPGNYVLETTTDDGARVYLDDKLLVDEWKYQGPTLYTREVHLGGKHRLHVEHFQIDGYWALKVAIRPRE